MRAGRDTCHERSSSMRQYKRILAAIGSAVLLISNLGSVTQTVFAVEQPPAEEVLIEPDAEPEQTGDDSTSEPDIDTQTETGDNIPAAPAAEDPPAEPDDTGNTQEENTGEGTTGDETSGDKTDNAGQGSGDASSLEQNKTDPTSNESDGTTPPADANGNGTTEGGPLQPGTIGETTEGNTSEGTTNESDEDEDLTEVYEAETTGIAVRAATTEDAFSEPVTLVTSMIDDDDTLDDVTSMLDESDVTYDGYVALDIHFENESGKEVEPSGIVKVAFELGEDIVPTEANRKTLEIQHIDESNDTTNIVTVADTTDNEDTGTITVSNTAEAASAVDDSDAETSAAYTAEFKVTSFSTFTITWKKSDGTTTKDTSSLRVVCKDMNGDLLVDSKVPDKIELESGRALLFNSSSEYWSSLNISSDATLTLNHAEAAIATYTDGSSTVTKTTYRADSITATFDNDTGKWSYSITGYLVDADGNVSSESTTVSDIPEGDLTLVLFYNATGIKLVFNVGSGTADTTLTEISGQPSSRVHIPSSYTATRSGYAFLGWTTSSSGVVIGGNRGDYRSVYPANSDYRLPESATNNTVTLYAAWSNNTSHDARFFIRFGSNIPAEPDSASADDYTSNTNTCQVDETITKQQWIIDTDTRTKTSGSSTDDRVDYTGSKGSDSSGTKTNFVEGVYIKSDVYNQLDALLDISTLCSLINNKRGSTGYTVAYDSTNQQLEIDSITDTDRAGDRTAGERLYILWYVQKPANYNATTGSGYWNIDGILVRANEVSITYDGNETADCNSGTVPTGYSTSPGTEIHIGASGSATSDTILTPTRTGYEFIEWNTEQDGSGIGYRPYGTTSTGRTTLTLNENTILYAIWSKLPRGSLEIAKNVGGDTEYVADPDAVYDINLTVKRASESNITNNDETITLAPGEHPAMLYNADGTAATVDSSKNTLTTETFQYDSTVSFEYNTTVTFTKQTASDNSEDEHSVATVHLKDGQRIVIYSLYDNAIFTVTESEESARGFNVIYSGYDPSDPTGNRLESNATTTVTITNRKRVVKTGVETTDAPMAAVIATITLFIIGTTAYHKARRYMH